MSYYIIRAGGRYLEVIWPIFIVSIYVAKLCTKHTTKHAKRGAARGGWGHTPGNFEKWAF